MRSLRLVVLQFLKSQFRLARSYRSLGISLGDVVILDFPHFFAADFLAVEVGAAVENLVLLRMELNLNIFIFSFDFEIVILSFVLFHSDNL